MKIRAVQEIPLTTQVNRVGKYLYTHLDGAYKYSKDRNTYDIYLTVLYEPKNDDGTGTNDVYDMTVLITITTYQNKLRYDTITMTPEERTLGFDTIASGGLNDLSNVCQTVHDRIVYRITRAFPDCNLLF